MYIILLLVEFVPLLALIVRRLRDVGIHWGYIFIVFVPLGALTLLIMLAMPSQRFREKVIENSEKMKRIRKTLNLKTWYENIKIFLVKLKTAESFHSK